MSRTKSPNMWQHQGLNNIKQCCLHTRLITEMSAATSHWWNTWFSSHTSGRRVSCPQTVCKAMFKSNLHSLASVGMKRIITHWSNKFGNQQPLFVLHTCWWTCLHYPSYSSSWLQSRERQEPLKCLCATLTMKNVLTEKQDCASVATQTIVFLSSFQASPSTLASVEVNRSLGGMALQGRTIWSHHNLLKEKL